jgi:SSS family solute:Na+ symporter
MSWIDWTIIVVYLGAILAMGFYLSSRQEDEHSFFLGNRSMPGWAVTVSIVATSLSAGTFVGLPQVAFNGNLTFLLIPIGSTIGGIVAAVLVVPILYRANTLTIYGYLRDRYGPKTEVACSWFFLVGVLLAQGARHFIASIVVSLMLFGSSDTIYLLISIVILGVIATIYTAAGGIHAVIWTDVIQVVILTGAALLCIGFLLVQVPVGIPEMVEALKTAPEGNKLKWWNSEFDLSVTYTVWTGLIAYMLMNIAQYGCDQDMVQRMMTCKSASKATWSMILSRVISFPIVVLFLIIGLLLYLFYARPDIMGVSLPPDAVTDTKNVFPQYILAHLPRGIVGLVVAGMLAASMSSFDSAANAMASTIQGNLRKQKELGNGSSVQARALSLLQSRRTVYWMGGGLTLFAALAVFLQEAGGQGLIDFSLGVLTFAYSGLFGVFMAAILTKRGNETSAVRSLWAGALVVLSFQPYIMPYWSKLIFGNVIQIAWPWWFFFGGVISFLVCISGKKREWEVEPATSEIS